MIQSIRYPETFDYEFEVNESLLDCQTMKLILQPVVENCIYHGLKGKTNKGMIRIAVRSDGSFLVLTVADNGYGMRQETIDRLYASFERGAVSDNVGLRNVYQRIMIYYKGNAEMIITSELDEGTVITIKEPLNRL
jgi:two-component system sensor histidine kinase YesM